MDIQGSVVLVTGANRGVGAAFVRGLLDRGAAKVYAGARDVGSLPPSAAVPVQLDITDADSVARAAAACADVTIVINNAGIGLGGSLLEASTAQRARAEMETNYFGTMHVVEAFAPVLGANGGGAVANMLSVLSWYTVPALAGYCASKAATLSLTNAVRDELAGQGTQVLAIHVGAIDTDMGANLPDPKSQPADVVSAALDALEAGLAEVLVDETSHGVRAALSGDLALLYPSAAARGSAAPQASTLPPAGATAGKPTLDPASLEASGAFVEAAGLIVDEVTPTSFAGHIEVGPDHHTPWGIVHGGVYATAIESAASIAGSDAVRDRGMVAVGLTNTTHFLRSITAGRASVVAEALNQGRTQQLWQVNVRDDAGRLLAHGEVRLQNLAAT
ncbi:MAG: 3-oxoacyl-[acyl-carrier-protein] reductase FabG [Acidimicrobiales bacterium]|nr:3-oxoacyl-[acyl-carrier-protein] reductase FabG [Acidimicrobiales bacterium]